MSEIRRFGGQPPSPYETQYGFSRTVAVGPFVLVGGTTSIDGVSGVVLGETPYEQSLIVLRKLLAELARLGGGVEDALQLRAYVTDISRADEVGRAFGEVFGVAKPLFTMVEVSALIDPRMLVEIELVASRG
jgi:enamine deaminase RidA (YjgF/YER057c/UK114 family)